MSNWDPGGMAAASLAITANLIRNAAMTRHPVAIAAAVGGTYIFMHNFANIPAVQQGASAAATNFTQGASSELDRLAQVSFPSH